MLSQMDEIYLVRPGGGDEADRARRAAEERTVRHRYADRLVDVIGLDSVTAHQVMATLFGDPDDRECQCSCHPRLSTLHDGGFDCQCTWDADRRAAERRRLTEFWDTPAARELREQHADEESAIAQWVAGQSGVEARRSTSFAPEQWEGTVDGHSFYFRERHGCWRIELDLEPTGRFTEKLSGVDEDGEPVTKPTPILEGEPIAEGVDTELGDAPIEHVAFIVRKIRDHLRERGCDHDGTLTFCPKCGQRRTDQ